MTREGDVDMGKSEFRILSLLSRRFELLKKGNVIPVEERHERGENFVLQLWIIGFTERKAERVGD